jgi:hypothetical protein
MTSSTFLGVSEHGRSRLKTNTRGAAKAAPI